MVSHAEIVDRPRRASSVASRSRKSATQRRTSHRGGTQYTPQNEFPIFTTTGDVEIVIACDGQEKKYLLHRLMLAQCSGFFDHALRDQWPGIRSIQPPPVGNDLQLSIVGEDVSSTLSAPPIAPEQTVKGPTPRRRWRYELDWDNAAEDEEPILVQKSPQGSAFTSTIVPNLPMVQSRPPQTTTRTSFFRSMANLSINHHHMGHPSQSTANIMMPNVTDSEMMSPLLRDYDNLFRMFYNHTPVLNSTNIASAYSECKSLLLLADTYDALSVVGSRVDHHLLRFSSRLFKQIAKYPPSYLKLGYLARSRIIFSEALTHVVGQWPAGMAALKSPDQSGTGYDVPINVLDLIEDKAEELEEMKSKIEARLFRLTLTTSRGERVSPSNDYLGWLAMSLWRQWLAENTTPEIRGILKNGPATAVAAVPGGSGHTRASSRGSNHTAAAGNRQRPGSGHTAIPTANNPYGISRPNLQPQPQQNTGKLYRLIASTDSQSFLNHDELKRFLKLYPTSSTSTSLYTREMLRRFERKMEEIKNVARDIVKPLTRNFLELDLRSLGDGQGGSLGYLTCMKVEENEVPWL